MIRLYWLIKFAFAANALAFLLLLVLFLIAMFLYGPVPAQRVWDSTYCCVAIWSLSLFICAKFLKV
jgi:hypothetical protein